MNERPVEYSFVLRCIVELYPEKILDVGTGHTALAALLAGCSFEVHEIDNLEGFAKRPRMWLPEGSRHKVWKTFEKDIVEFDEEDTYDAVTCISTLEHIRDYDEAMRRMFRALKSGGHLILTIPHHHKNFQSNVYALGAKDPDREFKVICRVFTPESVKKWLEKNNASLVMAAYYRVFTGEHWRDGVKLKPEEAKMEESQLACFLLRKGH